MSWALGNNARPTPAISRATKMAGNDSITSHTTHQHRCPPSPPRNPASNPNATPTTTDSATEAMPTTKRNAGAVDQCRQDVSALVISAQRVLQCCPPSLQAGGRPRIADSSSDAQVKRVVRCHPPAQTAEQNTQTSAMTAASDRHGRRTESCSPHRCRSQRRTRVFFIAGQLQVR